MTTMTTQLETGDFVTPTVRLLRPLAEGGMGRVWIAEHLGLHAQVVVKLMADEMAARPDGAERFAREAAVAAAIKSPHVVQVFDHGVTTGGVPYIVMDLLEGRDLGAHLTEHGRMDPLDVVALVVQIGKALSKAHKASIVHRDIKPDNIFLCDTDGGEMFVKLLDFGTAKREDPQSSRTTVPGQIMGTPYYMSPEQSVGASDIDERSDIWSLGVVAFEALTGQKPFDGASVGAITIAIHGPLPRMTDLVPDLPPSLDVWFARACAQAREDRFRTAREMTNALALAVTGATPVDQPTESVCFPPVNAKGNSTPVRPVTRPIEPLIASLPERGSERRATTIAAGVVMATAVAAMVAIVLHRSPAPAAESPPMTHAADVPSPARPPEPAPAPAAPPFEPEPTLAAPALAPRPASAPKVVPLHGPETRDAHAKGPPPRRPSRKDGGALGHEDDDLVRLTNAAAQHADPQPAPSPSPKALPAPSPESTGAAPAPPPLPAPPP